MTQPLISISSPIIYNLSRSPPHPHQRCPIHRRRTPPPQRPQPQETKPREAALGHPEPARRAPLEGAWEAAQGGAGEEAEEAEEEEKEGQAEVAEAPEREPVLEPEQDPRCWAPTPAISLETA